MKIRLIKAVPKPKDERLPDCSTPSGDNIRSWVDEFRSNKAAKALLNLRLLRRLKKT
jgi:hypothetical protein